MTWCEAAFSRLPRTSISTANRRRAGDVTFFERPPVACRQGDVAHSRSWASLLAGASAASAPRRAALPGARAPRLDSALGSATCPMTCETVCHGPQATCHVGEDSARWRWSDQRSRRFLCGIDWRVVHPGRPTSWHGRQRHHCRERESQRVVDPCRQSRLSRLQCLTEPGALAVEAHHCELRSRCDQTITFVKEFTALVDEAVFNYDTPLPDL